jgi:O-antigen/teichoic acid export membrane protein
MVLGRVVGIPLGLGLQVVLARALDPGELGMYFLVLSVATTLGMVAVFGQDRLIFRQVAEAQQSGERTNRLFFGVLLIATLLAIALAIGYVGVGVYPLAGDTGLRKQGLVGLAGLTALLIVSRCWQTLIFAILLALKRFKEAVFFHPSSSGIVRQGVLFILIGVVWWRTGTLTLETVLTVTLVAGIINAVGAGFAVFRRTTNNHANAHYPFSIANSVLAGWPLMTAGVLNMIYKELDFWMVSAFLEPSDMGLYRVGTRMAEYITIGMSLVMNLLWPFIADLHVKEDISRLRHLTNMASLVALILSLGIFLLYMVMGTTLLDFLFGSQYMESQPVMIARGIGFVFMAFSGPVIQLLSVTNEQRYLPVILLLSLPVNIGCVYLGLMWFGAEGAAYGATMALVAQYSAYLIVCRRRLGFWPNARISREALSELRRVCGLVMRRLPRRYSG